MSMEYMYRSARFLREYRHDEYKYAHASEPVGKASPEKYTLAQRFNVVKHGCARRGKTAYCLEKGVYERGDSAAYHVRYRTYDGYEYSGYCHYGKAFLCK